VVVFRIELDNFPEMDDEGIDLVVDLNFGVDQPPTSATKKTSEKTEEKLCGSESLQLKKVFFYMRIGFELPTATQQYRKRYLRLHQILLRRKEYRLAIPLCLHNRNGYEISDVYESQ